MSTLDFQVGDIVQITPKAKEYAGRVGEIIGCRYIDADNWDGGVILYTVRFSDKKSAEYDGMKMRRVRRIEK